MRKLENYKVNDRIEVKDAHANGRISMPRGKAIGIIIGRNTQGHDAMRIRFNNGVECWVLMNEEFRFIEGKGINPSRRDSIVYLKE